MRQPAVGTGRDDPGRDAGVLHEWHGLACLRRTPASAAGAPEPAAAFVSSRRTVLHRVACYSRMPSQMTASVDAETTGLSNLDQASLSATWTAEAS